MEAKMNLLHESLSDVVVPCSGTYLQVEPAGAHIPQPDVVVLGIPFDMGVNPERIGSRQGPEHIRHMSRQLRRYLADIEANPFEDLNIVDAGNVAVTASRFDHSYPAIQDACEAILNAGAIPLTMGGDGSVTLPQLRAASSKLSRDGFAIIHLDAHTDSRPGNPGEPYSTWSTFFCGVEEGTIDPNLCSHIGVRGTSPVTGSVELAKELGFEVVSTSDLREAGVVDTATRLRSKYAGLPIYICWDMDIFDPSTAPGVCAPEWGGLSSSEGISFIRALTGAQIMTVDINTVSPPHDVGGITGSLAARIMLEFIYLMASSARIPSGRT